MEVIWPVYALLWPPLIAISTLGAACVARRASPSTTWVSVTFAGVLISDYGVACLIYMLPPTTAGRLLGEALLAHAVLFLFFWPMTFLIGPFCVGSIVGGLIGMRLQNRIILSDK